MFLLLLLLHRLNAYHFPPPQKWAKLLSCFIKNFRGISAKPIAFYGNNLPRKFLRNWLFLTIIFRRNLTRIFLRNSCEISRFFHEFVSKNPTKFDFFSVTHQRPCVMNGLRKKVLDLVAFFSIPPPPHFFPFMNVNYVQS